ncbi:MULTISPECIES: alanine racemase [Acinetobacter]|uniref:alanine racemase n=1 Tax=Acinetobacter TaxID=469 RepID=UPI00019ADAD8|nr:MULTISPECIES: alanine racemase [Acinetobacter]EEH69599.1 alanine racemase domain protein [Acinetobacter sp. ATCC 27244]NAR52050.1 alanine racemase [Acinetobacter haemolyticus]NAR55322.1 alanine racemase [Acinetobacter haemolyticus]NAR61826.1 alanine racemase [Acinetobacter haemolyticus]NAR67615.1 alanine racemase [Acinetobacter haemolyticus]
MLDHYFKQLNLDLKKQGIATPQLIVDEAALKQNIQHVQIRLEHAQHLKARLVVKSLASLDLLKLLSEQIDTQRFMVFHQPHIILILENFADADILLGKPMPAQVVHQFFEQYMEWSTAKIQWLIDTKVRLQQYLEIAKKYSICLDINIEIDVGLHRGGVQTTQQFTEILALIQQYPQYLKLSGLMGYDAHVTKVPAIIKKPELAYQSSQQTYANYQKLIQKQFPTLWHDELCFNGGGSPTFSFHTTESVCNDLSFGSMLLKPSDFDHDLLQALQPAVWIAAPVLKVLPFTQLPSMAVLDKLPHKCKALFIYGGYWMANYVYPDQAHTHVLYGRSSNQELINVPKNCDTQVDDFVFLRPTQSEAIIPQFSNLMLYKQNRFESWQTFRE